MIASNRSHVQPSQRFSGDHCCPICGGADDDRRGQGERCFGFISDDGKWAHCTREEFAGRATVKGGSGTYAHALKGPCPCGEEHAPADPKPARNGKGKGKGKPTPQRKEVACYNYNDEYGRLVFQVVRCEPKSFLQRRLGADGQWDYKGPDRPILYRLPELTAVDPSRAVFVAEGEKGVEALRKLGLIATCSPGGAGKWRPDYGETLKGRKVIILPDNDDPGRAHADQVALALQGIASEVRVVELPDLPPKGDPFDWVEAGGTAEALKALVKTAPVWSPPRPPATVTVTPDPHCFALTDVGNGERLAARSGSDLRYVGAWGRWLCWDGRRWALGHDHLAERMAKATARSIYAEAAAEPDDGLRKAIAAWAKSSESRDRLMAMLWACRSESGIPIRPDDLDAQPYLLALLNGTLDLKAGTLRPHRREDLMTSLAPVSYEPAAMCPTWDAFLNRIFRGDREIIGFVQRLCGSALTGDVSDQILPILYGVGANGKSTLVNVILEILGPDLALKAPPGLLMLARGEAHPTERAILHGKRLAVAVETAEGARLNEVMVKELTGSDHITARRMREDFWTFRPTHKVWLTTNHRPMVSGTDHAIWRRLTLIPFGVTIPTADQDRRLLDKLRGELPGILSWCVRGCMEWKTWGICPPESVASATQSYREDEDILGTFLASECLLNPNLVAKATPLFARYVTFTEGSGERPLSQRRFGQALAERGFERYSNNGTCYRGIGLRTDDREHGGADF